MKKYLFGLLVFVAMVSCAQKAQFSAPAEMTGVWYGDNMFDKGNTNLTRIEFREDGAFIVDNGGKYAGGWSLVEGKPVISMFNINAGYQWEGRMYKKSKDIYIMEFYFVKPSGEREKSWVLNNLRKSN